PGPDPQRVRGADLASLLADRRGGAGHPRRGGRPGHEPRRRPRCQVARAAPAPRGTERFDGLMDRACFTCGIGFQSCHVSLTGLESYPTAAVEPHTVISPAARNAAPFYPQTRKRARPTLEDGPMSAARCPELDELAQFVTGNLSRPAFEHVARHVESCAAC